MALANFRMRFGSQVANKSCTRKCWMGAGFLVVGKMAFKGREKLVDELRLADRDIEKVRFVNESIKDNCAADDFYWMGLR